MFNFLRNKNRSINKNIVSFSKGIKYDVLMSDEVADIIESLDISPKDAKAIRELHDVLNSDCIEEGLKDYNIKKDNDGGFFVSPCEGIDLHIFVMNKYIRIDSVAYDGQKYHVVEKMHEQNKEPQINMEVTPNPGSENDLLDKYMMMVMGQPYLKRSNEQMKKQLTHEVNSAIEKFLENAELIEKPYVAKTVITEDGRKITLVQNKSKIKKKDSNLEDSNDLRKPKVEFNDNKYRGRKAGKSIRIDN